jgi:ABC-2 type transport system ATP-binding protein
MLIEIRNLRKLFKTKVVFKSLDLDIPEKGIVLIKGKNGAGKSTLLKIISKFIKKDSGEIIYNDPLFFKKSSFLLDEKIMIDSLTFEDNMMLVGSILKMKKDDVDQSISFYKDLFHLPDSEYYGNFSLGMKKKAEIARTLLGDPKYIFWDEPFNSLDTQSVNLIMEQVINDKKLFLIITHENILDSIATDIIVI